MREVRLPKCELSIDTASFLACLATILELPFEQLPVPAAGEDPATGWTVSRWLGGLGLGIARIADAAAFSWPGPWIARICPSGGEDRRSAVMYGVPSGVVWDPGGDGEIERDWIADGFVIAAIDIALARPPRPSPPVASGIVELISVAPRAGEPAGVLDAARAIAGQGLEGDRHVDGTGTFPSGTPGSDRPGGTTFLGHLPAEPRSEVICHPPPRTEILVLSHWRDLGYVRHPPPPKPYFWHPAAS